MKVVAENFTTDEKNISEMFTSVESMIGSILSIRPIGAGNRTSNLPESVMPSCKSGGPEDNKLSSVIELTSMKLLGKEEKNGVQNYIRSGNPVGAGW